MMSRMFLLMMELIRIKIVNGVFEVRVRAVEESIRYCLDQKVGQMAAQ